MEVEEENRDEAMAEDTAESNAEVSRDQPAAVEEAAPAAASTSKMSLGEQISKTSLTSAVQLNGANEGSVNVALHPLVIMNISDHWTRVKAQEGAEKKVIGAVIGQQKGRNLELMNSFELCFDVIDGAHVFDKDYYGLKETQFKQVFGDMELLGWYTTGGDTDEADVQLHQQICEINESPVFVKLNPTSKDSELPVSVYESIIDIVEGEAKPMFVKIPYTLATEEAERIGVDHVARFTSSASGSGSHVAEHLGAQFGAVKMLHSRVKFILEYLKAMERGEVKKNHDILQMANAMAHQLPVLGGQDFYTAFYSQCNEITLIAYLAALTKNCQTLNNFVNKFNILYDRQSLGRRMRGMFF